METFAPKYNEDKIKELEILLSNEVLSLKDNLNFSADELSFREKELVQNLDDLTFDASRHYIPSKSIGIVKKILTEVKANEFLEAIWSGKIVNNTENRRAMHPALRAPKDSFFPSEISNEVHYQRKKMLKMSESIRNGELRSSTDEKYSSILAIGIGGSDLGPRMTVKALKPFSDNLEIRFISNIDPGELINQIHDLKPSKTLVIVSSKTFTTLETLTNADAVFNWMMESIGEEGAKNQRIAITESITNAKNYGFKKEQILNFCDWVGGRTSIWSSVGFPLAIAIGEKKFNDFLSGGHSIDKHMKQKMINSIPSLMAILGYIQRNYIGSSSQCIVPYDVNLSLLPSYLQQLEMESNGKNISKSGDFINSASVPVIWGQVGTDSQHSFFQLLHQGSDKIPIDILVARSSSYNDKNIADRHRMLVANALGQSEALFRGKANKIKFKNFAGTRSVSLISYNKLTPYRLGSLIAIYEYKVIIQSALWRINPFDQFGVELGKEFANALLKQDNKISDIDPELLNNFLKLK